MNRWIVRAALATTASVVFLQHGAFASKRSVANQYFDGNADNNVWHGLGYTTNQLIGGEMLTPQITGTGLRIESDTDSGAVAHAEQALPGSNGGHLVMTHAKMEGTSRCKWFESGMVGQVKIECWMYSAK